MPLIEDDSILHPEIDEDQMYFITGLKESHEVYGRFFDALLIRRNQHRAFFYDLRGFREQPQVISLLDKAGQDKKIYREITIVYLNSRYAHPWCRKTPLKKSFWRAEWGNIDGKPKDPETMKEEERLHKLLVPIWIIMRSKMFPGEEAVKDWCTRERASKKLEQEQKLTSDALKRHNEQQAYIEEAVSLQNGDSNPNTTIDKQGAAHAATSVLRLAAAGLIISQTPKRKLRWIVKKPT